MMIENGASPTTFRRLPGGLSWENTTRPSASLISTHDSRSNTSSMRFAWSTVSCGTTTTEGRCSPAGAGAGVDVGTGARVAAGVWVAVAARAVTGAGAAARAGSAAGGGTSAASRAGAGAVPSGGGGATRDTPATVSGSPGRSTHSTTTLTTAITTTADSITYTSEPFRVARGNGTSIARGCIVM